MSFAMRKVEEDKRRMRERLAALPFAEKLRLLEELRDRSVALGGNPLRRVAIPPSHLKPREPR